MERISFISSSNPISRSLSASSITRPSKFLKTKPLVDLRWSSKRPGVAMSRFTPFSNFSPSARLLAPPMMTPRVWDKPPMRSSATLWIWIASSLVGVITTTPVPFRGLNLPFNSMSKAGMRKARVLPDPVFAAPSTSFPARRGGMHLACTSVNFSNPKLAKPFFTPSWRGRAFRSYTTSLLSSKPRCLTRSTSLFPFLAFFFFLSLPSSSCFSSSSSTASSTSFSFTDSSTASSSTAASSITCFSGSSFPVFFPLFPPLFLFFPSPALSATDVVVTIAQLSPLLSLRLPLSLFAF
mmetsp:Transcript_21831/g.56719  ORF Transcript_21831/g.56719 Transcript_21831/m.56719 type:complete len:295 (-) Transcript_21831:22-906(-)